VRKTPCLPESVNSQGENIRVKISQPVKYSKGNLETVLKTGGAEIIEDITSLSKHLKETLVLRISHSQDQQELEELKPHHLVPEF
jgi:hypothetical protein